MLFSFLCIFTFQIHSDDVIVSNKVPTRQQLRHFEAVGSNHISDAVASDAVGTQTQAGGRVNAERVLLNGTHRKGRTKPGLAHLRKIQNSWGYEGAVKNFRNG